MWSHLSCFFRSQTLSSKIIAFFKIHHSASNIQCSIHFSDKIIVVSITTMEWEIKMTIKVNQPQSGMKERYSLIQWAHVLLQCHSSAEVVPASSSWSRNSLTSSCLIGDSCKCCHVCSFDLFFQVWLCSYMTFFFFRADTGAYIQWWLFVSCPFLLTPARIIVPCNDLCI